MASGELSPLVQSSSDNARSNARSKKAFLMKFALGAALLVLALWLVQDHGHSALKASTTSTVDSSVVCGVSNSSAGYIKLPNKENDHSFYWFYESRSSPETDPLVLWLTGGPGSGRQGLQ
jgi:hypothetical protein